MSTAAASLPAELEAELAALMPFASYDDAVAKVHGSRNVAGLSGKYARKLDAIAHVENMSDVLRASIGAALAHLCDHAIALHAPLVDKHARIAFVPLSSLTQEEKDALV